MEIVQTQKYLRISPRKLRSIAGLVKKLEPAKAVEVLPHLKKRGSLMLLKVVKTALANAKEKGLQEKDLVFKEIQVNEGPRLKRGRAVARGRLHPYKKRMSHIRVVLEKRTIQIQKSKETEGKTQSGRKKKEVS